MKKYTKQDNMFQLGFPAGLFRPGKSREGPGTGRARTGPRDLEGPVVLAGQDLETLKVPWSWQDRT